jgi:DNA helicase-2/ATP-dependent DNA helicase PcrA
VQSGFDSVKAELISPNDIEAGHNYFVKKSLEIFKLYEAHCHANDLIDFAELLVRSYELDKIIVSRFNVIRANAFVFLLIDKPLNFPNWKFTFVKLNFFH